MSKEIEKKSPDKVITMTFRDNWLHLELAKEVSTWSALEDYISKDNQLWDTWLEIRQLIQGPVDEVFRSVQDKEKRNLLYAALEQYLYAFELREENDLLLTLHTEAMHLNCVHGKDIEITPELFWELYEKYKQDSRYNDMLPAHLKLGYPTGDIDWCRKRLRERFIYPEAKRHSMSDADLERMLRSYHEALCKESELPNEKRLTQNPSEWIAQYIKEQPIE